jgi:hypothetical protein
MELANIIVLNMADQITASVDGGAGPAILKVYDENGAGVPPLTTAITTQLLIAEPTLNDPSFENAVDANPGGRIELDVSPIPEDTSANNTATATPTLFGRVEDSNGTELIQFTESELGLNTDAIVSGSAVQVTLGSITVPES